MNNDGIIIEWDSLAFDPDTIGIILITTDGRFIYGKKDKNFQGNKYRISHLDIFDVCLRELNISHCFDHDQMAYAYNLASERYNIISLQIMPVSSSKEIIVVLNLDSNNRQLDVLYTILEEFAKYNYIFTADICYDDRVLKSIYDESSKSKIFDGIEFNEFMEQLKSSLAELKENKKMK